MRKVYNGGEKQAGAELGQAQLKLELGFTLSKICCIKLMTRLTIDFTKFKLIPICNHSTPAITKKHN